MLLNYMNKKNFDSNVFGKIVLNGNMNETFHIILEYITDTYIL